MSMFDTGMETNSGELNCFILFTDFGPSGPYTGQMEAVLKRQAPDVPIIHLVNDAPVGDPRLSSYLLAALRDSFPQGSIFLAIVDPGVGGQRKPVVLLADGQYFVGPDNDLLNTVAAQAEQVNWWEISWRPARCSMSFHGRDLFAPVAASLVNGTSEEMLKPIIQADEGKWPADLPEIIYFDHYGNAMTGIRYRQEISDKQLIINSKKIMQADTFCSVEQGGAFWYQNSSGLVEIAVNQGRAKEKLALTLGTEIEFV